MQQSNKVQIKVCLGKEIHVYRGNGEFLELDNYVKQAFAKKLPEDYFLTYKDEDGDSITVSCDEDLQAFQESQKIKKLFITENISSSDEEKPKKSEEKQQQNSTKQEEIIPNLLKSLLGGNQQDFERTFEPLANSFVKTFENIAEQQKNSNQQCQFKDLGKMFQQFKPFCQQQQQKTEEDFKKAGQFVHQYVICDGCQTNPIQGMRYKCTTCDDFDYCGDCLSFLGEKHGHEFEPIENSVTYHLQQKQQQQQQQQTQQSQQTQQKPQEVQKQQQQEEQYVLIQEENQKGEVIKTEEVQEKQEEKPQVQEKQEENKKELAKNYSTVVRAKAGKIAEILGGDAELYYGVCDCQDFSKDNIEYIVGQLLETPQLTEVYSSYK